MLRHVATKRLQNTCLFQCKLRFQPSRETFAVQCPVITPQFSARTFCAGLPSLPQSLRPACHRVPRRAFASYGQKQTLYEVLGIAQDAAQPDIKKKYFEMAKKYHPDLHPNDKQATARFQAVADAYAVLGDPLKRSRYDRSLRDGTASSFHEREQHAEQQQQDQRVDPMDMFSRTFSDLGFSDIDNYIQEMKAEGEHAVNEIRVNHNWQPAKEFAFKHKLVLTFCIVPAALVFRFPALALAALRVVATGAAGLLAGIARNPLARRAVGQLLMRYWVTIQKRRAEAAAARAATRTSGPRSPPGAQRPGGRGRK